MENIKKIKLLNYLKIATKNIVRGNIMCKIGDIIAVNKFIGDGNNLVGTHYFIVINDKSGKIEGLNFDIVSTVMSSFKSEKHKKKKLKYKENMEISEKEGKINNKDLKDGYAKLDQLYYFEKKKTNYFVVGQVDGDVLINILQYIQYLDSKGKLKQNIENIKEKVNC